MKNIFKILIFTLIFGNVLSPTAQAASPVAGAKCVKFGQVKTYKGKNFTCIQSGKKLIWNNGVAIKLQNNATPAPTATPTSATPTPIAPVSKYLTLYPVESPYKITWENIVSKINDISAAAWLDAQATIKRNQNIKSTPQNFYSYISPGALKVDPNIGEAENLLNRTFTLYTRFPKYPNVYFVALTTEERKETEKKILSLWGDVAFINRSIDAMYGINSNSPAGSVFSAPKCTGNDSGRNTFTATAAAVIVGVCPSLDGRDVHLAGVHAMSHEYVHMIQSAFLPGQDYSNSAPCWMFEGETEWTQTAVSETFTDYLKSQNFHPYLLTESGLDYVEPKAREWTATEVAQYLMDSINTATCAKTNQYALSYSLGAATTEALVSIAGSESVFALHQRLIDNMPYSQAFKEVYGITWESAVPILSQVVAKKITKSWDPDALTYQTRP